MAFALFIRMILVYATMVVKSIGIMVSCNHEIKLEQEMTTENDESKAIGPHDPRVNIQIDRVHYQVASLSMTGAQLRALPATPIPADRDLFLVVPGSSDKKISDDEVVPLHNGARFFTAPGQINPGCGRAIDAGGDHGIATA